MNVHYHPSRGPQALAWVMDRVGTIPYFPVGVWLAVISWAALWHGGLVPVVHHILPGWLSITWTLAFAIGATAAALGALLRVGRMESAGLGLLGMGLAFYGVVALCYGPDWLAFGGVLAFGLMAAIRLRVLALSRRAAETATLIMNSDTPDPGSERR